MEPWLYEILVFVSWGLYSLSSYLCLSLLDWKKDIRFLFLALYLASSVVSDLLCYILQKNGLYNIPVINMYMLVAGMLLLSFFWHQTKGKMRTFVQFCFGLFILSLLTEFVLRDLMTIVNVSYSFLSFVAITLSMSYLLNSKRSEQTKNEKFIYWANSGIAIYYGSTLLMSLFQNTINSKDLYLLIWPIQLFANIFINLIIIFGLWVSRRNLQSQ